MKKNIVFIAIGVISLSVLAFFSLKKERSSGQESYPVLLVGTNAEYAPFTFIKDGNIVGFDIDIITEVTKRLAKQLVIKDLSFDVLIPDLQLGNLQVVAAGLTPTEERKKRVLFSKAYNQGYSLVICVKKESDIHSFENLKGKIVAVNEGYYSDTYISQFPDISIVRLGSAFVSEGILALDANRADAFVSPSFALKKILEKENNEKYRLISVENQSEGVALAISKKHEALLPIINSVLSLMKDDGTIDKFIEKWELDK
jgi:ABC-type amino acid transport substrate-binding protein